MSTTIRLEPWSPYDHLTATTLREAREPADVTQLRELIAHAAPLGADITIKDPSPEVVAWVRSQPFASFGHTESGDFMTAWFIRDGIWVTAQCRRGQRGWVEPTPASKEAA